MENKDAHIGKFFGSIGIVIFLFILYFLVAFTIEFDMRLLLF